MEIWQRSMYLKVAAPSYLNTKEGRGNMPNEKLVCFGLQSRLKKKKCTIKFCKEARLHLG